MYGQELVWAVIRLLDLPVNRACDFNSLLSMNWGSGVYAGVAAWGSPSFSVEVAESETVEEAAGVDGTGHGRT